MSADRQGATGGEARPAGPLGSEGPLAHREARPEPTRPHRGASGADTATWGESGAAGPRGGEAEANQGPHGEQIDEIKNE